MEFVTRYNKFELVIVTVVDFKGLSFKINNK